MVADPHWAAAQEVERPAGGQWDPMECGSAVARQKFRWNGGGCHIDRL
jgi:hypothetical protein